MPAIAIALGSTLIAVALVSAFVISMMRVVRFADAHFGPTPAPATRAPRQDKPTDPDWWPRFERQFASYVDQLGDRRI
jgi:hypothetical protein